MKVSVIDNSTSALSAGVLGTVSTKDLLNRINNKLKTYTNNITFENMQSLIQKGKDFFVKNIVKPYQDINNKINTALSSINEDKNKVQALVSKDDFLHINPIMIEPILFYKPVRDLFLEDRIFGFGIDKEKIINVKSDRIRQLINNGRCYNVIEKVKNNKPLKCVSVWKDNDPDYSLEDLEMIEQTRLFIDKLLEKHIDPTDVENNIG